ncbi:hypothetical protein, conserved [Leishmania tarentolae]|uniref:Uncharacterized protein n=1 Tax=Leishmania tarentolae TaxID=5689 RepID=A0A640KSC7_LEITA|nr:hypothetical protein, conserved [Leishmania tarentolae]
MRSAWCGRSPQSSVWWARTVSSCGATAAESASDTSRFRSRLRRSGIRQTQSPHLAWTRLSRTFQSTWRPQDTRLTGPLTITHITATSERIREEMLKGHCCYRGLSHRACAHFCVS